MASALFLTSTAAHAEFFERISSFPVATNLPAGSEMNESSAEIISATADGQTLVYSDSPLQAIGFVDLSDPMKPEAAGTVALSGEPTSVLVSGQTAFAAINTSTSYTETSGTLVSVDVASKAITSSNPYRAVSAVLQAAKLGFDKSMKLQPAEDLDGIQNVRAKQHVPANLDKALNALDRDKELRLAMGEMYCNAFDYTQTVTFPSPIRLSETMTYWTKSTASDIEMCRA
jgi:hypothetical protein